MQKISEERATYQKSSTLRSNEQRRHFTLGSHQRSALDSRGVHRRSSKRWGNLLVRYMNALVFRPLVDDPDNNSPPLLSWLIAD